MARRGTPVTSNLTTDYTPTPDSYYTSPDTRVPVTTVEPVNTDSSAVPADPPQGYDVEAHQRLANYSATSLEDSAQAITSQNNFINNLFDALAGTVS